MASKRAKHDLFDAFASVAKAVASGRRAEILDLLAQGPRSVEEIAAEIDQSVANTSHHLRLLARGGLLDTEKSGTRVFYRLASPRVLELWRTLREVAAEQVAEVERLARDYLGDRQGLEPLAPRELLRRIRRGDVTVLDVRPEAEFASGHIAGARSVPISELSKRLKEVDRARDVVAYCRGPYCVFADEAVRLLRRRGYQAFRLRDGFPEWREAGFPVAARERPA